MEVVTVRLEPELVSKLDDEADEKGFSNRTEYIRFTLRNRSEYDGRGRGNGEENTAEYKRIKERVAGLESRVDDLEAAGRKASVPDRHTEASDDGERVQSGAADPSPRREETGPGAKTPGESRRETASVDADEFDEVLQRWRPGRNAEERKKRHAIGVAALEWLQGQHGWRSKADFVTALYEDTAAENQQSDTWWEATVRECLNIAVDVGLVETTGKRYQWDNDEDNDTLEGVYDPSDEF